MAKIFQRVGAVKPRKSAFNLSYEKKFTCDFGQLIPVMCDEVVPGDFFKIGNQMVIRFQPLVAPILHEINVYVHYFFVPYRILWDDWEDFITGGVTGDLTPTIPTWSPTPGTGNALNSLWDYLGFPTGIIPAGALPLDFPRRAYNMVWNEYYRDETLQTEVALTNEAILLRNWAKDYFTSSLTSQQRGTAPALPVSGHSHAIWDTSSIVNNAGSQNVQFSDTASDPTLHIQSAGAYMVRHGNAINFFNSNTVDLSSATTFDIADLRLAFQIQKWMERNNRAGARYTEFLEAHFKVSPRDDRLQRPEYIGGSKAPVIVSEVLQTSSTDTESPQGNLAGHALTVSEAYCGKYHAQEYGLIIGLMSVMPKASYSQGINRQWLRRTKYDFYFPEFANLSEQAIERAEIYASAVEAENLTLFGYQGRYDEMRIKQNMIVSEMRDTFDYWHCGRQFASAPLLNSSFVECNPSGLKRIFASTDSPGLIVSFGNLIKAVRPLPIQAEPGLIDHV